MDEYFFSKMCISLEYQNVNQDVRLATVPLVRHMVSLN